MQNPWVNLPKEAPLILPEDKVILEKIAWREGDRSRHRFEMYPVPYIGNPQNAEVYLLTLNPGFAKNYREEIENQEFVSEAKKSYSFESNPAFYFLDRRFSMTDGYMYYTNRLRELIEYTTIETVASKVMCIEYFPYHSEVYKHFNFILPSQHFSFYLVKEAMRKNKVIIFQRSKKLWINAIPELESYPTIQLRSYRAPYISKRNIGGEAFKNVVNTLME